MKIQLMLNLQGEFIKVTNNKAKTITIATLRFCDKKNALYDNCWELKTTKNAQNKIDSIIIQTDTKKLNNAELTKILQYFKNDFGIGDKYCEQKLIIKVECDDLILNVIDDDIMDNLDRHEKKRGSRINKKRGKSPGCCLENRKEKTRRNKKEKKL